MLLEKTRIFAQIASLLHCHCNIYLGIVQNSPIHISLEAFEIIKLLVAAKDVLLTSSRDAICPHNPDPYSNRARQRLNSLAVPGNQITK